MENQISLLRQIYNSLCCLNKKGVDCDSAVHVKLCETPIMEIESATLQGCWEEVATGVKVSIEIIRNEDGTFNKYEIHKAGTTPIQVTTLANYIPCPERTSPPLFSDICGQC